MNSPDFSQSPEHVALAKAMYEAIEHHYHTHRADCDWPKIDECVMLTMADAAVTFFGAGYRLPDATEANAERLAQTRWRDLCEKSAGAKWDSLMELTRQCQRRDALTYLRALHAMMVEPAEKPEPVFPGMPAPEDRCSDGCVCERCGWPLAASVSEGCVKGNCSQRPLPPMPTESAQHKTEGPGPDFAAEATERERRRLLEAFMRDMVSNPAVMAKMLEFYGNDRDAEIGARVAYLAHAFAKELAG